MRPAAPSPPQTLTHFPKNDLPPGTIAEQTVSSRMSQLESQGFLLSMPMEDHVDLLRASSSFSSSDDGSAMSTRPPAGVAVQGVPKADILFGGPTLEEAVEQAAKWVEAGGKQTGGQQRRETLSFLACRFLSPFSPTVIIRGNPSPTGPRPRQGGNHAVLCAEMRLRLQSCWAGQ